MGRLLRKKSTIEKNRKWGKLIYPQVASTGNNSETGGHVESVVQKGELKAISNDRKIQVTAKPPLRLSMFSEWIQRFGVIAKSIQFLKEVRIEINKVAWPSKQETIASATAVIAITLIMSIYIGMIDLSLSIMMDLLLQH